MKAWLSDLFQHSPLTVLFAVAAIGFLAGKIRVFGFSLGVAAVLFAGLAVGWLAPHAQLPELVAQLGLVLFVYTLGLSSGPGFFAALKFKGLRDNALALGVLFACAALTVGLAHVLGLAPANAAGLFAGALTNTPALGSVVEALGKAGASAELLAVPVVAYSLAYPFGVIVPLATIWIAKRSQPAGASTGRVPGASAYPPSGAEPIVNATVLVDRPIAKSARDLRFETGHAVNFGRIRRGDVTSVVHDDTTFRPGDLVTVIGCPSDVLAMTRALGAASETHIDLDRSEVDFRRMFVSNPDVTCRPLRELRLIQGYDAVVTRVRRGDVELAPHGDFEFELGDRARIVAPRRRMAEVQKLLGDSQRAVAEVDVITFGLGISIGLVIGALPIPVPGGGSFRLGLAGGPLIVGLILGKLGRTGPLVWSSPFAANQTLRQLGIVLFLAGVGVRAGHSLGAAPSSGNTLSLVLAGAAITLLSSALAMFVGRRVFRIPLDVMLGTLSGIQTQPAVLAFATEKSGNDLPNIGYTTVYPIATIGKILLCQAVLAVASR